MKTAELRAALEADGSPHPWVSRKGYAPDKFEPKGYRYVQFGLSEKASNGLGTSQLAPGTANLIALMRNNIEALLAVVEAAQKAHFWFCDATDRRTPCDLPNCRACALRAALAKLEETR